VVRSLRGPLVLAGLSLVLALAGTGLVIAAAQVRGGPAAANTAVTDPAASRRVIAAVSAEVSAVFSYSYADIPATQRAAQHMLAGQAAAQYREIFPLLSNATAEQLTVVSRVTQAGVMQLSGNTAQVLVFIDQTATRAHDKSASARAQLTVTAQLRGVRWLITGIQAR
jgi:Mce-associated membrane protein